MRLGLLVSALGASICGCAATMYSGPKRPDTETMLVETSGMTIWRIDGVKPPSASHFRLLPGMHRFDVAVKGGTSGAEIRHSELTLPACFTGRPGHTYLVRPKYFLGRQWRPEVIDENVTYSIKSDGCSASANSEDGEETAPYKAEIVVPLIVPVPVPVH